MGVPLINVALTGAQTSVNEVTNVALSFATWIANKLDLSIPLPAIPCLDLGRKALQSTIRQTGGQLTINFGGHNVPEPSTGISRVCVDSVTTDEEREGWGLQGSEYYTLIELEGVCHTWPCRGGLAAFGGAIGRTRWARKERWPP